jgi:hypothetical protein
MSFRLKRVVILSVLLSANIFAFKKTNGTPLGGMGTGFVKFNARTGDFGVSGKTPPPAADGYEFSSRNAAGGFHFYANDESTMKAKTDNEEAGCPLYFADFGETGGVTFILNSFGPFVPGENPEHYKLATSPMALFEVMAINGNAGEVEVAAAMEFGNNGLLGGANNGTAVSGNRAVSFSGSENAHLAVDCDGASPQFSVGNSGTSFNGVLPNSDGNAVAAKCMVAAGDTVRFKFVLAWWRKYENSNSKFGVSGGDKENYWYHNNFNTSEEVAAYGIEKFDYVRNGIVSFVNRVRASNFPDWYIDRLLNNNYPLIHNAQCTKDGRVAFWEGKYGIIGTIDQGQHAALFYTFNWPTCQWRELEFWGRTAWQGNTSGQIHHDFNQGVQSFNGPSRDRFVCPWDQWNRPDYWWVPDTKHWSDLKTMFLFKAYELMLATGNSDSIRTYFPLIKATGERLIQQSEDANSHIPKNSESTYDEPGVKTPNYACGIALAAYLAVVDMAEFIGEDAVAAQFREMYLKGREEYRNDLFNGSFGTGKDISEGDVAGYSWAHYLCLDPIMDSDFVATAVERCYSYYSSQSNVRTRLGRWHFYGYDHFGGAAIAIGDADMGMEVHKWDYDYYYTGNPGYVFWQTLQRSNNEYASYMTAPCVWRSYFQMTGYMIDNAHNRLWIRPSIPSSMDKKITNALLLNPKGMGTLNYDENTDPTAPKRIQKIDISFDSLVTIKEIVLKNNTGSDVPLYVALTNNGQQVRGVTSQAEGSGFEKNIRVTLADPITIKEGLNIEVYRDTTVAHSTVAPVAAVRTFISDQALISGKPLRFSVEHRGPVSINAFNLSGVKIGTLFRGMVNGGKHFLIWNGKTSAGNRICSGSIVLRLQTSSGSVTRQVLVVD